MTKSSWLLVVGGLLVVVGLPLLGNWARRTPPDGCALDGGPIDPLLRVRIVDDQGESRSFCCIVCATMWLKNHAESARTVFVSDELSGEELEAGKAYFVRSGVMTKATTENHTHVFRNAIDAERHAATGGTVLHGEERPFHRWERAGDPPDGK